MPLSHAMSEHGMVGGAVAVKSATLASELEQPDKIEPTEVIPKAEEGPARCPAVRFRFLLYPYFHFGTTGGSSPCQHSRKAAGTNQ
jgi:hypothetical protein